MIRMRLKFTMDMDVIAHQKWKVTATAGPLNRMF